MEEELRGIADKQKFNVDKLVDLVKENGEILDKMKVRELGFLSGCWRATFKWEFWILLRSGFPI